MRKGCIAGRRGRGKGRRTDGIRCYTRRHELLVDRLRHVLFKRFPRCNICSTFGISCPFIAKVNAKLHSAGMFFNE